MGAEFTPPVFLARYSNRIALNSARIKSFTPARPVINNISDPACSPAVSVKNGQHFCSNAIHSTNSSGPIAPSRSRNPYPSASSATEMTAASNFARNTS